MQRIKIAPRPNWQARARELGFTFHSLDGETYWDESAYYAFSLAEMEREIEDPAQELEELCRAAVARIAGSDTLLERLRVPKMAWELIRRSWRKVDLPRKKVRSTVAEKCWWEWCGHGCFTSATTATM